MWYGFSFIKIIIQGFSRIAFLWQNLNRGSLTVFVVLVSVCVAISNLFLYCHYGDVTTESFLRFDDSIYELKWYDLPTNLQRPLIAMIANAQKPLYYHGFGIFHLNLQLFTQVSPWICLVS